MRCSHEARLWDRNSFVTLTYGEVPEGGSLRPRDFVLFMKRLRMAYGPVRFFQCGEYGGRTGRPHHHALLFGLSFPDARYYKGSAGRELRTSESLERLWSHGQCSIGEVTFESAGYVARYGMKSVDAPDLGGRVPPYLTMSRRPGIGRVWAERYRGDWYRSDFLVVNGKESKPPRYYDQVQEKLGPSVLARVKVRRRVEGAARARALREQLGPSESYVREEVKEASVRQLTRDGV